MQTDWQIKGKSLMKISVFGLGYVGTVSAACLAAAGHRVIGVDKNETKVELVASGNSPIVEEGVAPLIAKAVSAGVLSATTSVDAAISDAEVSIVCVGTPSQSNGALNLQYISEVCSQIGSALSRADNIHVVVIRSTMLPGSIQNTVIPALESSSQLQVGKDFGLCINPEFLREGSAVSDYYNPPKTVIGEFDTHSGDVVCQLYKNIDAPLIRTSIEIAEMTKYVDNSWHALKVAFANEIGAISKKLGMDSHQLMDIFIQDKKLNISPAYLKPGFAFGGSCLPKDLRAINYLAKINDLDTPILRSVLPSNRVHIDRAIDLLQSGSKKLGFLGLSFKAGTDDLRESPVVEVVERLLGKGFDIKIYDRNVSLAKIVGANREFLLNRIPHISSLLEDNIEDVIEHADNLILGNNDAEFLKIVQDFPKGKRCIDLVRITDDFPDESWYEGIAW